MNNKSLTGWFSVLYRGIFLLVSCILTRPTGSPKYGVTRKNIPRHYILMHQSIPAAPSPPGYCGAFARLVSPRDGAFANFTLPGRRAFANPELLKKHAVSYQNITTQRILLEKQADWLICQGWEKIEEVCKGMFSILCMHFFIAYQARII